VFTLRRVARYRQLSDALWMNASLCRSCSESPEVPSNRAQSRNKGFHLPGYFETHLPQFHFRPYQTEDINYSTLASEAL
jgi:hypothetical protein